MNQSSLESKTLNSSIVAEYNIEIVNLNTCVWFTSIASRQIIIFVNICSIKSKVACKPTVAKRGRNRDTPMYDTLASKNLTCTGFAS